MQRKNKIFNLAILRTEEDDSLSTVELEKIVAQQCVQATDTNKYRVGESHYLFNITQYKNDLLRLCKFLALLAERYSENAEAEPVQNEKRRLLELACDNCDLAIRTLLEIGYKPGHALSRLHRNIDDQYAAATTDVEEDKEVSEPAKKRPKF